MQRSLWSFIACFSLAVAGCGQNPDYKQPSSSDSTADLIRLLNQRESTNKSMLMIRKTNANEILSTRGEVALPALFQAAQDEREDDNVRMAAAEAIGKQQKVSTDRLPELFRIRRGKNGILVNYVLERTCKAANKQVVVPVLVEFVKDEKIKYEDRQFIALILLEIDEKNAASAGVVKKTNEYLPNEK